jgi:RHS repeat-associated protein
MALADASGQIATNYTYTASGVATPSGAISTNTFEFHEAQNDGVGIYRIGARYYNPSTETFVSQDPIGFQGGSTDLYSYAKNDPINRNDPTGCDLGACQSFYLFYISGFNVLGLLALSLSIFASGLVLPLLILENGIILGCSLAAL